MRPKAPRGTFAAGLFGLGAVLGGMEAQGGSRAKPGIRAAADAPLG